VLDTDPRSQGWKGSAQTRQLVLALRDYFVERIEQSEASQDHATNPLLSAVSAKPPVSPLKSVADDEDEADPDTAMNVPLPDSWVTAYMEVKRLRYVQRLCFTRGMDWL
jgi:hypothetical protein